MSLIVVSGLPSSGKTKRVNELITYLQTLPECQSYKIEVISDEKLGIQHKDYYEKDTEKTSRAKLFATMVRHLSKNTIVILESLNYIKGFRYQIYCEAKEMKINSCVFYIATNKDKCLEFNKTNADPWPVDLIEALALRYEEPDGMSRWDSPLFLSVPTENVDYQEIADHIFSKKTLKPNRSVQKQRVIGEDYLTVLNSTTSEIVKEVLKLHRDSPGATVNLRGVRVTMPLQLGMPLLTRIRRNFIAINKQTAVPKENLETYFVEFLAQNWGL